MIRLRPPGGVDQRRRIRARAVLAIVAVVAVVAAALFVLVGRSGTTSSPGTSGNGSWSTAQQPDVDHVVAQIVSVFENGTPEIQYDYIEDLNDGRGYTAGRAGFCTACGDLLTVVNDYTTQVPDNALAQYVPTLTRLAASSDDSTDGLDGFERAWRTAAQDPAFRQAQDRVTDDLYAAPARKLAADNGVRSALGLAILVDTAVQQGTGDDPDGLPAVVRKTNAEMGGTPADGIDETTWLRGFLDIRRATLEIPVRRTPARCGASPSGGSMPYGPFSTRATSTSKRHSPSIPSAIRKRSTDHEG